MTPAYRPVTTATATARYGDSSRPAATPAMVGVTRTGFPKGAAAKMPSLPRTAMRVA